MTIADLAQYARACLSPPPGPVGEAIITAQQPQVEVDEGRSQALGWIVTTDGRSVKAGGNPGSSSYIVIDSPHGRAIALAASRYGLAGELTEAANAALGRRDEAHQRRAEGETGAGEADGFTDRISPPFRMAVRPRMWPDLAFHGSMSDRQYPCVTGLMAR